MDTWKVFGESISSFFFFSPSIRPARREDPVGSAWHLQRSGGEYSESGQATAGTGLHQPRRSQVSVVDDDNDGDDADSSDNDDGGGDNGDNDHDTGDDYDGDF